MFLTRPDAPTTELAAPMIASRQSDLEYESEDVGEEREHEDRVEYSPKAAQRRSQVAVADIHLEQIDQQPDVVSIESEQGGFLQ